MTGRPSITEFLRARLDEDERVAREAGSGNWTRECGHLGWNGEELPPSHDMCCVVAGDDIRIYDEGGHGPEQADHIARWHPARVLGEVEAKRDVVAWCIEVIGDRDLSTYDQFGCLRDDPQALAVTLAVETLRLLASPYGTHPDFDPAWAPQVATP